MRFNIPVSGFGVGQLVGGASGNQYAADQFGTILATVPSDLLAFLNNANGVQAQVVFKSSSNGVFVAGDMEPTRPNIGLVILVNSGATQLSTRVAQALIQDLARFNYNAGQSFTQQPSLTSNAQGSTLNTPGDSYLLRVINLNGGTLTLVGGTGVTINGTATIATGAMRDYLVTLNGSVPGGSLVTITSQD